MKSCFLFFIRDKKKQLVGYGYTTKKYLEKVLSEILSHNCTMDVHTVDKLYRDKYLITYIVNIYHVSDFYEDCKVVERHSK